MLALLFLNFVDVEVSFASGDDDEELIIVCSFV